MAFAAAIGPIISGIAGIAGAMISASAANDQAAAERAVAEANARELEKQAAREQSIGAQRSEQVARKAEQEQAKTRAALAQGGVSTVKGLGPLLDEEIEGLKFFNQNVEMTNAQDKQRTLEAKADITRFEGEVKARGEEAKGRAGLLGGFASAVKGIGGAAAGGSFG